MACSTTLLFLLLLATQSVQGFVAPFGRPLVATRDTQTPPTALALFRRRTNDVPRPRRRILPKKTKRSVVNILLASAACLKAFPVQASVPPVVETASLTAGEASVVEQATLTKAPADAWSAKKKPAQVQLGGGTILVMAGAATAGGVAVWKKRQQGERSEKDDDDTFLSSDAVALRRSKKEEELLDDIDDVQVEFAKVGLDEEEERKRVERAQQLVRGVLDRVKKEEAQFVNQTKSVVDELASTPTTVETVDVNDSPAEIRKGVVGDEPKRNGNQAKVDTTPLPPPAVGAAPTVAVTATTVSEEEVDAESTMEGTKPKTVAKDEHKAAPKQTKQGPVKEGANAGNFTTLRPYLETVSSIKAPVSKSVESKPTSRPASYLDSISGPKKAPSSAPLVEDKVQSNDTKPVTETKKDETVSPTTLKAMKAMGFSTNAVSSAETSSPSKSVPKPAVAAPKPAVASPPRSPVSHPRRKVQKLAKSPEEEAAVAAKYAAIPSVEERAYQILLDLGMIGNNGDD